jgi:isocitrate dehydrogenase (NAD+)
MPRVTLIEGDGIGPEVVGAMRRVVDALDVDIEWNEQQAGAGVIEEHGTPLPEHVLESIRQDRVAIKGPVTTPVGEGFRSVNVALRQELDLFANVRPLKLYKGVPSRYDHVDVVVVRENTEDLYGGVEFEMGSKEMTKLRGYLKYMNGADLARDVGVSVKPISISATRAIVQFAYGYARRHGRRKVTVGHKANIMKFSDGVWIKAAQDIAFEFPGVAFDEMQVDEMAMWLAWTPEVLDVIVLPNLYGDIISDLCAGLVGGLGMSPGMNLGRRCAIFEPTHGSAPDIAGKGIANPIAMILSAVMMLHHMGLNRQAEQLESAVATVLAEGRIRPADFPGNTSPSKTDEIADAIVDAFREPGHDARAEPTD